MAVADPAGADRLARLLVGRPLLAADGVGLGRIEPGDGGCKSIRLLEHSVDGDGRPLLAADLARTLQDRQSRERRWLLAPVSRAEAGPDGELRLCLTRDAPDLPLRLSHPAMWFAEPASWDGLHTGAGEFRMESAAVFHRRHGGHAGFEAVRLVIGDPALLLRLGEADIGVVHGAAVRRLEAVEDLQVRRHPARDRTYFLWFARTRRWVNDPRLRRWMVGVIDRRQLVEDLFAGAAEPALRLVPGEDGASEIDSPRRPLDAGTTPRLSLGYPSGDRAGELLARRLSAEWERRGFAITLEPSSGVSDAGNEMDLRLLVHEPVVQDSVIDVGYTLVTAGIVAPATMHLLDQASRWASGPQREQAARLAEASVLDSGELAPLVTVQAWRVTRAGFEPPEDPEGPGRLERWLWSP